MLARTVRRDGFCKRPKDERLGFSNSGRLAPTGPPPRRGVDIPARVGSPSARASRRWNAQYERENRLCLILKSDTGQPGSEVKSVILNASDDHAAGKAFAANHQFGAQAPQMIIVAS